jgi:hypothetical protein
MHLRRGGEMADTPALGAGGRKAVRVRIPLPALNVQAVALSLETRVIARVSGIRSPSILALSAVFSPVSSPFWNQMKLWIRAIQRWLFTFAAAAWSRLPIDDERRSTCGI